MKKNGNMEKDKKGEEKNYYLSNHNSLIIYGCHRDIICRITNFMIELEQQLKKQKFLKSELTSIFKVENIR